MLVLNADPFVSVIILNFNGERFLENCLSSLLNTNYSNFEVILVDNGSTDSSLKIVKESFGTDSRVRIVKNEINLGFSGGNNVGFKYSKGDYIAFLNNDTIVDRDWLAYLVDAMQNDASIGLAQSMISGINGEKIQTAGWLFSDYLVLKYALGENKPNSIKFQPIFEVSVASGASMIVKRALIEEIGLFDSKIPFFYDDTLLSFKVWLANKRVVTVSNSKIRHIGGAASAWNIERTTFNLLKAKICLMFDVYYRVSELSRAMIINAFSLAINSMFYLKRKNLSVVYANFHGVLWGLSNFRYLWRNRINHWNKTKISPKNLQQKFIRIKLPTPFYIMPSKLGSNCFAFEVDKYEKMLTQA